MKMAVAVVDVRCPECGRVMLNNDDPSMQCGNAECSEHNIKYALPLIELVRINHDGSRGVSFYETETHEIHPDIERQEDNFEWWHIFDTKERAIVKTSECQAHGAPDASPRLDVE